MTIRADPEHRTPAPLRRRADFLPDAKLAWGQIFRFARRHPVVLTAATGAYVAGVALPGILLARAHLGLAGSGDLITDAGAWDAAWLYCLVAARFVFPVLAASAVFLAMQRDTADARGGARLAACWLRVAAALLALKIVATAAMWLAALLPALLLLTIGPASALLTLLLIAPLTVLAALCLLRLSLAPVAMALGLPKATSESWHITHGHLARMASLWCVSAAPLATTTTALLWWPPDSALAELPLTWLTWLLASAMCGQLYRLYRVPLELRPDRRPSRHPSLRLEPVI